MHPFKIDNGDVVKVKVRGFVAAVVGVSFIYHTGTDFRSVPSQSLSFAASLSNTAQNVIGLQTGDLLSLTVKCTSAGVYHGAAYCEVWIEDQIGNIRASLISGYLESGVFVTPDSPRELPLSGNGFCTEIDALTFDFASTSIYSYTIPAGQYARLRSLYFQASNIISNSQLTVYTLALTKASGYSTRFDVAYQDAAQDHVSIVYGIGLSTYLGAQTGLIPNEIRIQHAITDMILVPGDIVSFNTSVFAHTNSNLIFIYDNWVA